MTLDIGCRNVRVLEKKDGRMKKRGRHIKSDTRHGRRVPKPIEKWLTEIGVIATGAWQDADADHSWLPIARKIAAEQGCNLFFDPNHHWQESHYVSDATNSRGERLDHIIAVGGGGLPNYCCTAFLHEFGHYLLILRGQNTNDLNECEEAAWRIAQEVAREHRLPCVANIRRTALYSYRYGRLYQAKAGSTKRTRRRPKPKSVQLTESKRSAAVSSAPNADEPYKPPLGKKGKRMNKKFIKRSTAKAERKAPLSDE